jgi:hypothetical protein
LNPAHIDSSDENLNQCRWLIDEDIAVTPDNVLLANRVDCINAAEENVSSDFYARAVTEALAMGKKATDATMSQDGLIFDMAKKACDVLGEATADDIVTLESDNIYGYIYTCLCQHCFYLIGLGDNDIVAVILCSFVIITRGGACSDNHIISPVF